MTESMKTNLKKLSTLIGKYAEKEGCSRTQIEQMRALVNMVIENGVPGDEGELERILKKIGEGGRN